MPFFQAARRGDNAPYKYVLTIIAVVVGAFIGQIPLGIAVTMKMRENGVGLEEMEAFQESLDFSRLGMDSNLALFLMLLSFVAAAPVLPRLPATPNTSARYACCSPARKT